MVPLLPRVRELALQGAIPSGTKRNLASVAHAVTFDPSLAEVDQLILADAQTSGGLLIALPIIDRWQDLPALARRIHADTAHERLALLTPDETTIAMLDFRLKTPFTILTAAADAADASAQHLVAEWFKTEGSEARVLVLLPGHAPGPVTLWLGRFLPSAAEGDGIAGTVIAARAAALVQRYELPQGRRYALLGPPP